MKITRIRIKNYRAIEELDVTVGPDGLVAKGKNQAGKSSVLHAIQAALAARDIKGDAVRIGSDRCEVLIDTDAVDAANVRRTIPREGTTKLTVTGADGVPRKRPKELLDELLGCAALDPLELMSLEPKERRAKVLAALPISVSDAALREWAPSLPAGFQVKPGEHGFDAVERAHASLYEARTIANKDAERLAAEAAVRANEAHGAMVDVADPFATVGDAEAAMQRARSRYSDLAAADKAFAAHAERTSKARERVTALRAEADDAYPDDVELTEATKSRDDAVTEIEGAEAEIKRLRVQIAKLEQQSADAARKRDVGSKMIDAFHANRKRSDDLDKQAADLETTLNAAAPEAPAAGAVDEALAAIDTAQVALLEARALATFRERTEVARVARANATAAAEHAKTLDVQVRKLANDAPKALLAGSNSIDGLEILGDDIALDGVRSGALCGMEAMWFCTQISMRSAKAGILICDGAERLDQDQYESFVRYVHKAGFQPFFSRVEKLPDGSPDMILEAVSP